MENPMWFEIKKQELEDYNSSYENNLKARRKRELTLITTCLIALIYSFPVKDFKTNPEIEIPAISLKILLKDAIAVFPTIVSSVYLVYFSSVINHLLIGIKRMQLKKIIDDFLKTDHPNETKVSYRQRTQFNKRLIILPSPLHVRANIYDSEFNMISRAIVDIFVGFVFNVLPYITVIFVTIKSYTLSHNIYFLIWNISCITIMLSSFLNTMFSNTD